MGESVDGRADLYALGCVAYYLLTGELVFEADTPMKMFLHHVQTPPVPQPRYYAPVAPVPVRRVPVQSAPALRPFTLAA